MSLPHDFDEKVRDALPWEKRIAKKIEAFLVKRNIRNIGYSTPSDKETQHRGIDLIVEAESSSWEIKTRDHKYYNKGILLETKSVVENNTLGWLYTSEADVIAYCWLNESETNVMPTGYFILLKKLRTTSWYEKLPNNYRVLSTRSQRTPVSVVTTEGNRVLVSGRKYWTTEFIVPPIQDFPIGTLFPFNALLPSDLNQSKLGEVG